MASYSCSWRPIEARARQDGTSFRGWVRENMSISLPTAYRLPSCERV